ncbi:MAG: ABC transporter permease [Candidatus Palauibacterales bacterium]|nr:ABC transporter permease [Candidatus Palauibacterales bacterium]
MTALRGFIVKEVRHILRDRQTLALLLLLPLVLVILFGFAIRTDIRSIRVAFVDSSPSAASLSLENRFQGTPTFHAVATVASTRALDPLFRRSAIDEAVVLPADFARSLGEGAGRVQVLADATDPNIGSIMTAYAEAVIQSWAAEWIASEAAGPGVLVSVRTAPNVVPETRLRFNPTLASEDLFVPGLIALVLTIVSAVMTSITLTREKERGTMETLLVSPLRPWQILVGKVAPYLVLGFVNLVTALAAARIIFTVPVRGSVTLLLAEGLLFLLVCTGLGVFISTRTDSQRAAMLASMAGLLLPTTVLSGMIFPISSMPAWLRPITYVIPARWFITIARGILLKGVGLGVLWPDTLVLALMAALLLGASTRLFKVRLA